MVMGQVWVKKWRKMIWFQFVPGSFGMLTQAFIARLEPVVIYFVPKDLKRLKNGPFGTENRV